VSDRAFYVMIALTGIAGCAIGHFSTVAARNEWRATAYEALDTAKECEAELDQRTKSLTDLSREFCCPICGRTSGFVRLTRNSDGYSCWCER
jgi:hypothetical protein